MAWKPIRPEHSISLQKEVQYKIYLPHPHQGGKRKETNKWNKSITIFLIHIIKPSISKERKGTFLNHTFWPSIWSRARHKSLSTGRHVMKVIYKIRRQVSNQGQVTWHLNRESMLFFGVINFELLKNRDVHLSTPFSMFTFYCLHIPWLYVFVQGWHFSIGSVRTCLRVK